jgi:hypothetical protein
LLWPPLTIWVIAVHRPARWKRCSCWQATQVLINLTLSSPLVSRALIDHIKVQSSPSRVQMYSAESGSARIQR